MMPRKTRMVAAVAAALVGTSVMAPAIASADASAPQEVGNIQYSAVEFGGPFALSAQLLGSLSGGLPNPGGGGNNQSGEPYASLFAYCDGRLVVSYDNTQKTTPTEYRLTVNGIQYDTVIVPAEQSRDYTFDIPLRAVAVVSGDGVELESLDTSECY